MRILAWIGGVAMAAVVSASALSALASEAQPARPFADSQLQASRIGSILSVPDGLLLPSPSPSPTTGPQPSKPAAAPRSTPAPTRTVSRPSVVVRSTQQSLINQDRARNHLPPLTWNTCLFNVARYEATHLAAPGVNFQHYDGVSRDLGCHLGGQVGENIGWYSGGINDSTLNTMFMNSPEHKANILGPYQYVATAWAVRSDGRAYIAVEFS